MATKRCPQCKGARWVFLSSQWDEQEGVYVGGTTLCGHCGGFGRVVMETEHNAKDVMQSDREPGNEGDQASEDRR
jgi:hypothetical protein